MAVIVVGVDGSAGAQEALRFALAEARLRGARVVAMHVWRMPLAETPGPFLLEAPTLERPVEEVAEACAQVARAVLDEAVAAEEATATVEVERRVVEGSPAAALIEASEGADMLVVGTRGHGGFVGLLLGSVGQQCAGHARCPVVVVVPRHTP